MPLDEKRQIHALMRALERFTESLKDPEHQGMDEVQELIRRVCSVSTRIMRFPVTPASK